MRLSYRQDAVLRDIAGSSDAGRPGTKSFSSGWPTYGALQKRGLITIKGVPGRYFQHVAEITYEGRRKLVPPAVASGG